MSDAARLALISSLAGAMTVLSLVVIALVVWYLVSLLRLIHRVKTTEPDLWVSLGRPAVFPMFDVSVNPLNDLRGLLAQSRVLWWCLKGGEGARLVETKAMVEKTRRLFFSAAIGMLVLFLAIPTMVLVVRMAANG